MIIDHFFREELTPKEIESLVVMVKEGGIFIQYPDKVLLIFQSPIDDFSTSISSSFCLFVHPIQTLYFHLTNFTNLQFHLSFLRASSPSLSTIRMIAFYCKTQSRFRWRWREKRNMNFTHSTLILIHNSPNYYERIFFFTSSVLPSSLAHMLIPPGFRHWHS